MNRSLGSRELPALLRADGWKLEAMFEAYGHQMAQDLADPPWIQDATAKGQIILSKDRDMRYEPLPRKAIEESGARVFVLADAELKAEQQAAYFIKNKDRIFRAAQKAGPYIYKVYENRIELWWPEQI